MVMGAEGNNFPYGTCRLWSSDISVVWSQSPDNMCTLTVSLIQKGGSSGCGICDAKLAIGAFRIVKEIRTRYRPLKKSWSSVSLATRYAATRMYSDCETVQRIMSWTEGWLWVLLKFPKTLYSMSLPMVSHIHPLLIWTPPSRRLFTNPCRNNQSSE